MKILERISSKSLKVKMNFNFITMRNKQTSLKPKKDKESKKLV